MKGELLALVKSMDRWEHVLKYQLLVFLVFTNASSLKYIISLKYMISLKSKESIFQHWFEELAKVHYDS